ncbi:MAG: iron-sulfur cluster carrier protein ApbC [Zoogloeaceae bacterium]|nr:iron-sulfur cluster carrier protein ApbC [Zoogloeaceae bacterium]
MALRESVFAALRALDNLDSGKELISDRELCQLEIDGRDVRLKITFGYPMNSQVVCIRKKISTALEEIDGIGKVDIDIQSQIVAHQAQRGVRHIPGVKNIIAIASGKGGVGKSTTATNLALSLSDEGARVGLLDADIYGPSIPHMLGLAGKQPTSDDGQLMEPLEAYGIKAMSIGFLIEADTPMIWRGPMVVQALNQLLFETRWGELDYLLIDLPPGTGDVQLSLAQKVAISGALMVTTPQDIALIDVKKGFRMFEKVSVPVLGVVENMSLYVCPECGHVEHIFGAGGGEKIGAELGVDCLGWLPLDFSIRQFADEGKPIPVSAPASRTADIYRSIARQMTARLALRPKDMSRKIPPIVVKNPA